MSNLLAKFLPSTAPPGTIHSDVYATYVLVSNACFAGLLADMRTLNRQAQNFAEVKNTRSLPQELCIVMCMLPISLVSRDVLQTRSLAVNMADVLASKVWTDQLLAAWALTDYHTLAKGP